METGVSFITYLNKIKLKNALNYIECKNKNISEIARLCGFNSTNYFCNLFRKEYGLPPLEYKKELSVNVAIQMH